MSESSKPQRWVVYRHSALQQGPWFPDLPSPGTGKQGSPGPCHQHQRLETPSVYANALLHRRNTQWVSKHQCPVCCSTAPYQWDRTIARFHPAPGSVGRLFITAAAIRIPAPSALSSCSPMTWASAKHSLGLMVPTVSLGSRTGGFHGRCPWHLQNYGTAGWYWYKTVQMNGTAWSTQKLICVHTAKGFSTKAPRRRMEERAVSWIGDNGALDIHPPKNETRLLPLYIYCYVIF